MELPIADEELYTQFEFFCRGQNCHDCEYRAIAKRRRCAIHFACERIKNEFDRLTKPTTIPAWCKIGAFVTTGGKEAFKIVSIDEKLRKVILQDRYGTMRACIEQIKPCIFREYSTVEEAKHLLDCYAESDCYGGRGVYFIDRIYPNKDGRILINDYSFEFLSKLHTTVKGIPIGIPEIDTEALKEVEQ